MAATKDRKSANGDVEAGNATATTTKLSMMGVQMSASLAKAIQRLAEQNGRTVQHEIRAALREHVDRKGG